MNRIFKIHNFIFFFILCSFLCVEIHAQSLVIQQVSDSVFSITANTIPAKNKLHWTTKPDSWSNTHLLSLKKPSETIELPSVHPILKLDESKTKSFYTAPRGVKLNGAINFRDIGGYTTTDGKQVKWGKIYRSADISKLTDTDLKAIVDLNIKMVCDLRGENESEMAPDRIPATTKRILLPAGSENVGGANSYLKYLKTPEQGDSMIRSFYTRTDHLGKKYKPMFDELFNLEPDQALLFHCTAGKDRTGVGAALILYSLGVEEASIYQDYEATNEFRKDSNEQLIKSLTSKGLSEPAARSMMAAKPEYLKAAFDAIAKQYGSVDNFLEKEIGLTTDRKKLLHSKFLY